MAIVSMEEWRRAHGAGGAGPGAAPPTLPPAIEIQIRRVLAEKDRVIAYQTDLIRQLQAALARAPVVRYRVKRRARRGSTSSEEGATPSKE